MGGAGGGVFAGLPGFGLFPTFNLVGLKPSNEGDFGRTRPPDNYLINCKVDLWYRFQENGVFMPRPLRSSMKTRL